MPRQRILILGGTGMLGHTLFKTLSLEPEFEVFSTVRSVSGLSKWFSAEDMKRIRDDVDAKDFDSISRALASFQPNVVINCIGLIKQIPLSHDPLTAITVNAQLPHRISLICRTANARMIHMGTDCVFNGSKLEGSYSETDPSDATDLYGRSKLLGEVEYPHCITLRTSIIGHEIKSMLGLVEWFLAQHGKVRGFTNAIFSGFPTVEIARIIKDFVLPNTQLSGVYQVSSEPISKYDLLCLIAKQYGKSIEIEPFAGFHMNRALGSSRFRQATGYAPPSWPELIEAMHRAYAGDSIYSTRQ